LKVKIEVTPDLDVLFGDNNENINLIEDEFGIQIGLLSDSVVLSGSKGGITKVERIFEEYEILRNQGVDFLDVDFNSILKKIASDPSASLVKLIEKRTSVKSKKSVQPRSANQKSYIESIENNDMVFGVGPAGCGKTYLSVAMAVEALESKKVNRIILVRPAVEAGEKLGFLPGTLQEKIDPYLRPLYDALHDLIEPDRLSKMFEKNIIEIAPLAFMRGRTLSDSFIILDEAQNTTTEQMKMFLTRLGNNSKAVITGDITQIDLPISSKSGLLEAIDILKEVEGIHFTFFDDTDIVRHPLVQKIVKAYDSKKVKI
jgi:phosphate starvation-inducible PhoH-like protein